MRKLLLALLLAIATMPAFGNTDPVAPAQTYQEFAIEHADWNRFAQVRLKNGGKIVVKKTPNKLNPFHSKAECVAGLESDTANIYEWLMRQGADIEQLDVDVTCEPAGQDS